MSEMYIDGMPSDIPEVEAAIFRTRISAALGELKENGGVESLHLKVGAGVKPVPQRDFMAESGEMDVTARAAQYESRQPLWDMSHLVAPVSLLDELETAVEMARLEPLIFDAWGLRAIEPFPRSVLNFHGPSGSGKTLAAHAVASKLGKPILVASYAQIESKYHGEGPKNVEALFFAAERDDAVLFVDEADSLLSKRLTNVTQGSEQAINSMRSQILICLERHRGIVIFATNLVVNYDQAFETRMKNIRFPQPDQAAREEIWKRHLVPQLPLAPDVDVSELASSGSSFSGREIKNAVVAAATQAARSGMVHVSRAEFLSAIAAITSSLDELRETTPVLEDGELQSIESGIRSHLAGQGAPAVSTGE